MFKTGDLVVTRQGRVGRVLSTVSEGGVTDYPVKVLLVAAPTPGRHPFIEYFTPEGQYLKARAHSKLDIVLLKDLAPEQFLEVAEDLLATIGNLQEQIAWPEEAPLL